VIPVPSDVEVWLASGVTDMRRGMVGLALQVQQSLQRDPHLCVGRHYVAVGPTEAILHGLTFSHRHIIIRGLPSFVWVIARVRMPEACKKLGFPGLESRRAGMLWHGTIRQAAAATVGWVFIPRL
jgi:hypothetical protein